MAGIHFPITADNTNFLQRLNEVKAGVRDASRIIQNVGKNFDVSTVEKKVIALNKVIRDNESVILQLTKQLEKWQFDAKEAFNNNDLSTFEAITKDIEEQAQKIAELTKETQQYHSALSLVESSGGGQIQSTAEPVSAPQFFKSQQDYEYAESLKEKIAELQEQISKFDGSDEDLQVLRSALSDTESKLRDCQLEAAQAASELGGNLGARAAEASEILYTLNAAIEKQQQVVQSLSVSTNEAAESLASLQESGDTYAIEDAQIKFDLLSSSLQNAQIELANLKAAQSDASLSFAHINQEVELHDSLMVKLLGGYENYQTIIGQLPGPIQGVIGSINGMTGAAKAFIATPLGAIIAAIVLALQALKTWFDSSVEGQLAFAEASGYVSGVLDQLKEIVITVGKAIYEAFSNPKKAVSDLWNAIKTNIVNRVQGLGSMFQNLGKVISESFSGNFDAAGDAFKAMTKDLTKVATGVDDITGKIGNYVKGVNDAAKANARLSKEARMIEIDASKESVESSKRNKRMQELRADMYSTDKSKGKAALEEYKKLSEEEMKAQKRLQERRIALQEEKMSLTTNAIEDENELRALQKGLIDIEASHSSRMAMLQRRSNSITSQTGKTDSQKQSEVNKAHQKVLDLMKQQAEDKLRLQESYERQRWQNRIDLMEEGEAKVLEQMRLDQTKERDALKEQEAQAIQAEIQHQKALFDAKEDEKAARTKGYGKQVFDPTKDVDLTQIDVIKERYAKLNEDLQKQQDKANVDRLKSAKEAMNAYLEAFGTYEQKRKAIEEKYNKQYAEAETHGERLMALANKNKATADLDFSQWSESGDMSLAFGDISKLSKDTISQLIADMEKYRTEVLKTFDIENIRKFDETLANLRTAEVDDSFFGDPDGLLEGLRERLVLQKQIYDEEQKQVALAEQQKQLKEELMTLESSILAGSLNTSAVGPDGEKVEQPGISEDDVKRADELRVKLGQVQKLLDNSSRNSKQLNSQLKQLGKVEFADIKKFSSNLLKAGRNAASLASVFSDDVADAITQGVDSMEVMVDSIDTISSSFNALAKSTANAVKDAANAGKSAVDAAGDGMKATAASTATSLSTMEKASAILAIIGAAIQLATMMVSLFSSDKKHEKRIKQLQDQIDALQISYDKLGRSIDNAFGSDASNLIEQQDQLLRQQKVLIRQQMAEEEAKKKTDDDKIKDYQDKLREIDELLEDNKAKAKEAIIGEDIKSAISEFASAYAEAWQDSTNAASASMKAVKSMVTSALNELLKQRIQPTAQRFYDALADAMKDGVLTEAELKSLDRLKAEMDAIAAKEEAQYKMLLDRYKTLEEIQEELTDTTFDSVRDDFKSLLSDMESSSADFSDSFTDMLRNALIEGLMSAKYDKMLQEWYAEFADKMADQQLTDAERDYLRQKYQAIVDAGIADRNAINEIVGQGAFAQSASEGGFAAMDQDTASELNGRFTAMVELQATSNTLLNDSNALSRDILLAIQSLNNVSQVTTGENTTLLAIKDMMFLSTGYLEDIATYSKRLVSIDAGIDNMRKTLNDKL